ncbi:hypothetical protein Tco_0706457 [Tanacetum coccineum]|uniref:Uncharacterized protein n=1 Tax=Tanacetum coccineum TaxID=301880 RepID=A0ABQ4Y7I7_9ASTR
MTHIEVDLYTLVFLCYEVTTPGYFSDAILGLFEAPPSPDYAPALDADTDSVEAPASPNYTPRSYTESELSEDDPKESKEDSSEEDPMEDDEPLPAQTEDGAGTIYSSISIEAAIAKEIAVLPHMRGKSPSQPPSSHPPSLAFVILIT